MRFKSFVLVLVLLVLSFSIFMSVYATDVELNTIEGPGNVPFYLSRFVEFADKTGIKVNLNVIPYGRDAGIKLIASFIAGGEQYDVFLIDCIEVAQYAEAGWVMPVDKWITPDLEKEIVPFAKDGMMFKGHWYGLPYASEWKSFVYNDKMLKNADYTEFPKTWDDVVKYSQKLQDSGVVKYATAFSWAQKESLICDFVAIAASFGGDFFDADLNPLFNKGGAVEALQWMVDSLYKYKIVDPASIMWTEDNVDAAMQSGDIAYQLSWGYPLVRLNDPDKSSILDQAKVGLMPSVDGKHPYTVSGPMGWSISKGTKYPEEAWKFIEFIAGPEGSKVAAIQAGMFSGWKSVLNDPEVQAGVPGLEDMAKQADYIVNRPIVPWYHEFSVMLAEKLHEALTLKKSPQDALNEAIEETLKIKTEYEKATK
jgi:multiple sugar transport system substrate-binding protein